MSLFGRALSRSMMTMKKCLFLFGVLFALTACSSNEFNIVPVKRYVIPQNGMYPTLPAKASFWVKIRPFFSVSAIQRGDIVVFSQERDGKIYDFIWRVIGLPGDQIEIRGMDVSINGNLLLHEKKKETSDQYIFLELNGGAEYLVAYDKKPKPTSRMDMQIMVPEGTFFFLGDNRDNAYDSRFTGVVAFTDIKGKKF